MYLHPMENLMVCDSSLFDSYFLLYIRWIYIDLWGIAVLHKSKKHAFETFWIFLSRQRVGQRAGEHSLGIFEAQRAHQGLVVVARNVTEFLNNRFRLDVAVRKLVIVRSLCVKDRLDDGALHPPAPVHRPFVVIAVESLHDVLPKRFPAFIALFEVSFFLRHELCERPKRSETDIPSILYYGVNIFTQIDVISECNI